MIWPLYRYILMAAWRDRFFLAVAGLLVLTICLAIFFGSTAITEQDQFARSFAAFGLRLFGVVALALFIVSYLRRAFESRDIDYLLSRPIGRVRFVLTLSASFSTLALLAALLLGGTTVALETGGLHAGLWLWWAGIAAEFVIVANVSMFFALVLPSATSCMSVVCAFYLLSRLIGEILGILQKGVEGVLRLILSKIMELISIFIPRFDLLGQTKWILYGVPESVPVILLFGQCAAFLFLVVAAAAIDMNRRQF